MPFPWFPRPSSACRRRLGRSFGGASITVPEAGPPTIISAPAPTGGAVFWVGAGVLRLLAFFAEMTTYFATPTSRQRDWYIVDAEGKNLGRLATRIADTLRGKRKPEYTPHIDTGDFVVVINAEKI